MNDNELKKCPFCGSKKITTVETHAGVRLSAYHCCADCLCHGPKIFDEDGRNLTFKTRDAWNNRKPTNAYKNRTIF